MPRKNKAEDVFQYIDNHGLDYSVCWEWQGTVSGRDNRPYFGYEGRKVIVARLVYLLVHGDIPENIVVRHKCDNPICCNPMHLELGTRGDNENDKYDRNRAGYTHDMIRRIRELGQENRTYAEIAYIVSLECGQQISASGVGKIIRGDRRRRHALLEKSKGEGSS